MRNTLISPVTRTPFPATRTKQFSIPNENNFGLLRLAMASLVVISHSTELLDGNRSREPLHRLVHTTTFAEVAVDGFFLLSGYLVTKSLLESTTWAAYLAKRVLRIYPGYLVACVVSLLVGFSTGGRMHFTASTFLSSVLRVFCLYGRYVSIDGAFKGLPNPLLNASLWTIPHEFRCYIFLLVLGAIGVLRNRYFFAAITLALLVWLTLVGSEPVFGTAQVYARFLTLFCSGSIFYLFSDRINYSGMFALVAIAILLFLLPIPRMFTPALATFGAYALFWFALRVPAGALARATQRIDLSYGLYLYAWPVGNSLIWCFRGISPLMLFACTITIGCVTAYLSWILIEKPCLRLKHKLTKEHGF